MKEWVPFFQSLLWVLLSGALIFTFKGALKRLAEAIAEHVEKGGGIEFGPKGLKLPANKLQPTKLRENTSETATDELPHPLYVVHKAKRDARLDKNGHEYYRLRIWLDADEPQLLKKVASVTYTLHSTFKDPVRTVSDEQSNFELPTAAWGEFNLVAEIRFKDGSKPLTVERYLNF